MINGETVERVLRYKYLGTVLDHKLIMTYSPGMGFVGRVTKFLNPPSRALSMSLHVVRPDPHSRGEAIADDGRQPPE